MRRPERIHWLRENARERTPHRLLTFDTETDLADPTDTQRQILRLWSARLDRRHDIDAGKPRQEWHHGTTASELAELIDRLARSDSATWIFAHNLGFDLAVTELPVMLAGIGWRVTEGALTTDAPWCRMARGTRRIVLTDSWSWLPTSVDELGRLQGRQKPELPDWGASADQWQERCDADVAITSDAVLAIMDWWDAQQLGNWSLTGPASGWSTYRHRKPTPRVLIDPDPAARAFEARAVMGGRRETRRVGELPTGLYADLDMTTAHLSAMAALPLPARRLGQFDSMSLDNPIVRSRAAGILAECVVRTDSPRYPWDSGQGIFYPVGTFRTVLAGPEVAEAHARGDLVSIGRGYTYLTSAHMSDWAVWLAGILSAERTDVPAVVRLMAKAWSRAVPGKWSGHTSDVVSRVPDPRAGWQIEPAFLMPGGQRADLLVIGGERWTIARDLWADDAFPAVLAWIQSATRVALGRLVDMLGSAVVSMNTDGLIADVLSLFAPDDAGDMPEDTAQHRALHELSSLCIGWDDALQPFSVRVKAASASLRVISPQHVIMGQERRLSGIPRRAVPVGSGRYEFTQWPGLRVQMAPGSRHGYVTRQATVDIGNVPQTGWLTVGGRILPVRLRLRDDGSHEVVTARPGRVGPGQLERADRQHPFLQPHMPRGYAGPSNSAAEPSQLGAWL
jgi:hypothetical protein